jgi:hypothetical protein
MKIRDGGCFVTMTTSKKEMSSFKETLTELAVSEQTEMVQPSGHPYLVGEK